MLQHIEGAAGISKCTVDLADTALPSWVYRRNATFHLTQKDAGVNKLGGEVTHLGVDCIPHYVVGKHSIQLKILL